MIPGAGAKIRGLRESVAWSPEDLAQACSLRTVYLMAIEDDSAPRVHTRTYQKIADALNVPLEYLFGNVPLDPALTLEKELEDHPWRWFISLILRLIIVLGTLTLTLIIMALVVYVANRVALIGSSRSQDINKGAVLSLHMLPLPLEKGSFNALTVYNNPRL